MCHSKAAKSLFIIEDNICDSPKSHLPFFLIGQPDPPVISQWVHSRDLYLKSVEALTKCWCCVRGFILMAVLLPASNQWSFGLLRFSRHQPRQPSDCARALPCQTTRANLSPELTSFSRKIFHHKSKYDGFHFPTGIRQTVPPFYFQPRGTFFTKRQKIKGSKAKK